MSKFVLSALTWITVFANCWKSYWEPKNGDELLTVHLFLAGISETPQWPVGNPLLEWSIASPDHREARGAWLYSRVLLPDLWWLSLASSQNAAFSLPENLVHDAFSRQGKFHSEYKASSKVEK